MLFFVFFLYFLLTIIGCSAFNFSLGRCFDIRLWSLVGFELHAYRKKRVINVREAIALKVFLVPS